MPYSLPMATRRIVLVCVMHRPISEFVNNNTSGFIKILRELWILVMTTAHLA